MHCQLSFNQTSFDSPSVIFCYNFVIYAILIAYSEKILTQLSTATSYHLFGVQMQRSAIESLGLESQLHSKGSSCFSKRQHFLASSKHRSPLLNPGNQHCCFFPKLFAGFICYKIVEYGNPTIFCILQSGVCQWVIVT